MVLEINAKSFQPFIQFDIQTENRNTHTLESALLNSTYILIRHLSLCLKELSLNPLLVLANWLRELIIRWLQTYHLLLPLSPVYLLISLCSWHPYLKFSCPALTDYHWFDSVRVLANCHLVMCCFLTGFDGNCDQSIGRCHLSNISSQGTNCACFKVGVLEISKQVTFSFNFFFFNVRPCL